MVPESPETGYGYIKKGQQISGGSGFIVERFIEKPNKIKAEEYLADGSYLWNSGNFIFRARTFLKELEEHAPDIAQVCALVHEHLIFDRDFTRIPADIFKQCRAESVDYAVMEKTSNATVVLLQARWSDVGAWDALWKLLDKDLEGNVLH